MHSSASFHSSRLFPSRSYGGEGDKVFTFVVTSDGEVYKQNEGWFGLGNKEYFFEYDARSGSTGSVFSVDVKGDAARIIDAKIVGSWDDFTQAKNYADNLVKKTAVTADPAKPTTADPTKTPAPPAAGGVSTGMLVGLIGGGVALMGGLLYLASRSSTAK